MPNKPRVDVEGTKRANDQIESITEIIEDFTREQKQTNPDYEPYGEIGNGCSICLMMPCNCNVSSKFMRRSKYSHIRFESFWSGFESETHWWDIAHFWENIDINKCLVCKLKPKCRKYMFEKYKALSKWYYRGP